MIIGTIRFLHLSPREGGAIERHFGLSARHFSLAPAGYYRQQGTKTGRKPKRDGNQQGQGTKPAGDFTAKGDHSLRCSNRCSIEASQDRGGITLHRRDQAREPKATGTNFGNRNHRQQEPLAKGNHRQRGTRTPTASFLSLLESWTTSKLATVTTPKAICLTSSPVEHRKRR